MRSSAVRFKFVLLLLLVLATVSVVARWRKLPETPLPKPRDELGKTLSVRQDFFDCGGGSPSEISQWTLEGDYYVSGDRRVGKQDVLALRKIMLASRESRDLISEFENDVSTGRITSPSLASRYPWIQATPPVFTNKRLQSEAQKHVVGPVAGSTSSIETEIFLGGNPPMRLRLDRADLRWDSQFPWGLPEWDVSVGQESWKSRSPRIAQFLLPLMQDQETFIDILHWPERFTKIRARDIGSEWAAKEVESILEERIGKDFLITPETPYRDYGAFRIASRQLSPLAGMTVGFDLHKSPADQIPEIVNAFHDAESHLIAYPWLKSLAFAGTTTTFYQNVGNEARWESANLRGKIAHSFYITLEGDHLTVLTGEEETRAIILDPNRALSRYVTLPNDLAPNKDLIVSTDGTTEAIDKFGDLEFQF